MHLVGVHFLAQRGVDQLVALDQALAFKRGRDDGGKPVAAIAFQRDMVAGQARGNDVLEFVSSHFSF
ncbi:hypothetical protein D3C72_2350090 [compost metagenome]